MKINNPKLAKYKTLFTYAGKLIGRIYNQNAGTHNNFNQNTAVLFKEMAKISAANNFEDLGFNSAFGELMSIMLIEDVETADKIEAFEKFFYDIVWTVAHIENVKIKYHFTVGDDALYGTSNTSNLITEDYSKYIDYLTNIGYSSEDLESWKVTVDPKSYDR